MENKKRLKDEALPPMLDEAKIINAILKDKDNIGFYRDNVNPDNFDFQPAKETVRLIFHYYDKYKHAPEEDDLAEELAEFLEKTNKPIPEHFFTELWGIIFTPSDIEYPRDKLLEWLRSKALKKTMLEAVELEKKGETLKAVSFIRGKMDEIEKTGIPKFEETVLNDVEVKDMKWLWRFKIPMGTISLIVGYQGVSKSYFSMMLAAHVSKGLTLPGEHYENVAVKGSVIILSAEDDPETTIKKRVMVHGGDCKKIVVIGISKNDYYMFNLKTDLKYLEKKILEMGDVKLIIIDPVSAYLGADMRFDSYRETHVRSVLAPVAELARKHDLAVVGIMHLNKKEGAEAINRVSGSGAFVAAARAVWLIAKSKRDKGLFHFCSMKFNLGEKPSGLSYRIKRDRIVFEDLNEDWDAEDLLRTDRKGSPRQEAREFLMELIKQKKQWDAEEVERKRQEEGISKRTLDRAKKDLKMKSIDVKDEKTGKWKSVWTIDE